MLKKLLLAILALFVVGVVAIVIAASTQPSEFEVKRSATIDAEPSAVFPHVNNFRRWEDWSPWADLDPDMEITYSGEDEGEGAVYEWSGNQEAGSGRMTIVESTADEHVEIKLEFLAPFESMSTTEFHFEPVDGQTEVTWTMRGENDFMMKVFRLIADMDEMIGADFDRGLAQLETAVFTAEGPGDDSAETDE